MALAGLLPKPIHSKSKWDDDSDDDDVPAVQTVATVGGGKAPLYGKRKGWVPRALSDFGSGGAFPEIHVAQYPLDMGRQDQGSSMAIVQTTVGADGKINYDALLKQGGGKDKIIHSTYDALVPVTISNQDSKRDLPDEEEVQAATDETREKLLQIVGASQAAQAATQLQTQSREATIIRYTPANQDEAHNSGAKQRVIRIVNMQRDPMEPPRFLTNKKIPRGPPSPPAPVLHSPPRKVTAEEQSNWKIPPAISSWKNQKGFTIPLDKRLAADGRGLQDVHINDNFARVTESLMLAERQSRRAIELRQQTQKKAASKEKDRREDMLRDLASKARDERAGIRPEATESAEVAERDQIRHERGREREREKRIAAAAPDKRDRLMRDRERDVSERIALGMPATNTGGGGYDSRLFSQSQGMDTGFKADDSYDVYDKAFRGERTTSIYRPTRTKDASEYTDEDLDKLKSSERFHKPDKGFSGTEGAGPSKRDGPVQFEKGDLFGLDEFLTEAKEGTRKRTAEEDDDRGKRSRK